MKINGKAFQEPDFFDGFNVSLDHNVIENQGVGEFQEGVFRNEEPSIKWILNGADAEFIKNLNYTTQVVLVEIGNDKVNVIFTSAKVEPIFGFTDFYKVEATILPVLK